MKQIFLFFHRFVINFSEESDYRSSGILMRVMLMLQYFKSQNLLRKSRNFAERFCRNSVASFMVSPHQETEFHIRIPPVCRRAACQAGSLCRFFLIAGCTAGCLARRSALAARLLEQLRCGCGGRGGVGARAGALRAA